MSFHNTRISGATHICTCKFAAHECPWWRSSSQRPFSCHCQNNSLALGNRHFFNPSFEYFSLDTIQKLSQPGRLSWERSLDYFFRFDSVFLVCQSTLYPPEFSYSLLSLCVSVSERKLWCTYGMQCSLLSLCREPERGHTPPNTHKLHTSDALHAAAVSQCFKGSLPLLCSLLASACHCPSGPFCAVCCCCLWFAALCSGPAAIPDLRGVWRGGSGCMVSVMLTSPPQGIPRHLSFSSHMFLTFPYSSQPAKF